MMTTLTTLAMLVLCGSDGQHAGKANRLANASSPYLLQHAYNPVDWYPWGEEAFAKARAENKPVFLSVGYAACHWCHVMERESFENKAIAKVLNEHFVSIKVDREERPDVDEIYMAATQAQTGRGGWPMSVFMTAERKPFLCGTYFPPHTRGNRQGFGELLEDLVYRWNNDRDGLVADASALVQRVERSKRLVAGNTILDRDTVSRVVDGLAGRFDRTLGGFRSQRNKFPPTMPMELILRDFATHPHVSKAENVELVELTLQQMAYGGIYDHIGGGICRYSVDPRWFAPHFEKMLYDQARVCGVYLSAYQITHNELYASVARSILDYCIADLQDDKGGFYSSRDADSEGEEGKFYTWKQDELLAILGDTDGALFCDYYNATPGGNWHHGVNILYIDTPDSEFATSWDLTVDNWRAKLAGMKQRVFDVRAKRIHPGLDDKILSEWNGMLINQLARAGRVLGEPRYTRAAEQAANFILTTMLRDGRLYRAHHRGTTHIGGYAADYANVIEALITLYETTADIRWIRAAEQLNEAMVAHFRDTTDGTFFYTAHDAETLIVRSKNARDSVVPSANSVAALNNLRLAIHLRRPDLKAVGESILSAMSRNLAQGALTRMHWALLFYLQPPKEIAIVTRADDPAGAALITTVYADYLPNKVVGIATPEAAAAADGLPLMHRKTLYKGNAAAYVCQNYVCKKPVTTPQDLAKDLFGP